MSLVDVRGDGPGSTMMGTMAPLGPASPLESPLGSPLVSLDAAVFVKGGLNSPGDPSADSFADDFLQTGSQLLELWASSKPTDTNPLAPEPQAPTNDTKAAKGGIRKRGRGKKRGAGVPPAKKTPSPTRKAVTPAVLPDVPPALPKAVEKSTRSLRSTAAREAAAAARAAGAQDRQTRTRRPRTSSPNSNEASSTAPDTSEEEQGDEDAAMEADNVTLEAADSTIEESTDTTTEGTMETTIGEGNDATMEECTGTTIEKTAADTIENAACTTIEKTVDTEADAHTAQGEGGSEMEAAADRVMAVTDGESEAVTDIAVVTVTDTTVAMDAVTDAPSEKTPEAAADVIDVAADIAVEAAADNAAAGSAIETTAHREEGVVTGSAKGAAPTAHTQSNADAIDLDALTPKATSPSEHQAPSEALSLVPADADAPDQTHSTQTALLLAAPDAGSLSGEPTSAPTAPQLPTSTNVGQPLPPAAVTQSIASTIMTPAEDAATACVPVATVDTLPSRDPASGREEASASDSKDTKPEEVATPQGTTPSSEEKPDPEAGNAEAAGSASQEEAAVPAASAKSIGKETSFAPFYPIWKFNESAASRDAAKQDKAPSPAPPTPPSGAPFTTGAAKAESCSLAKWQSAFNAVPLPRQQTITGDAATSEKSAKSAEQKAVPSAGMNSTPFHYTAAPRPAAAALGPAKRARLTASQEVTDSLGRKLCILPSLPRAKLTPTVGRVGTLSLPGLELRRPSSEAKSLSTLLQTTVQMRAPAALTSALTVAVQPPHAAPPHSPSSPNIYTMSSLSPTTQTCFSQGASKPPEPQSPSQAQNPILSKALQQAMPTVMSTDSYMSKLERAAPATLPAAETNLLSTFGTAAATSLASTQTNLLSKSGRAGPPGPSARPEPPLPTADTTLLDTFDAANSPPVSLAATSVEMLALTTSETDSFFSDLEHAPRVRPLTGTPAAAPSLAALARLREAALDKDADPGLSDSCASSSSAATSPGTLPLYPCAPTAFGVAGVTDQQDQAVPQHLLASDDLLDVSDVIGSMDISSQDSTQLSGESLSSSCSGTSSFSGPFSSSASSAGSCSNNAKKTRTLSPSRLGPQVCQVCSKIFSNASALAKHKLTHSDERRYACSVCSKAFKRQDHLNGHMLTHRNKKPYECTVDGCPKSYCDARSLRRHEENHHHLKGLPALKDKDSEKEARRRNSKTILSLLATPSTDSSGPTPDTDEALPPASTVTDPGATPINGLTAPENGTSGTAVPKPAATVALPTPMVSPMTTPVVSRSPVATPLPSPGALSPGLSPGLSAPVRTPAPSPITIPTVRPQLVAARVIPAKQQSPQQGMQFRLLLDQSFPQSPGAQGTLLLSRSPPEDGHPTGVLSAYLSPTRQLPQIQLAVSQPQLLTSQVQQIKVTTARSQANTQTNAGPIYTGLARQTSLTSMEKNDQVPKLVQSVTWPQVLATSSASQTPTVRLSSPNSEPPLVTGRAPPSQDMLKENYRPHLSAGHGVSQQPQQVNGVEMTQRQGVTLQATVEQSGINPNNMELKERVGYPPKQQVRALQKKSGLAFEIPSTSSTAPVSTTVTTTTTTTTTKSTVALTLTTTKSITNNSSTKQSTNSTGLFSGKTVNAISARHTQPIPVPALIHDDSRKSPKAQDAAALANQSKPVACNLCNRRFKNIPALNGHMRLHGGYFKKESESKRSDKRESTGPPLQTASVSVRQLIEEKIIQKRGGTIGRVALSAGRENPALSSAPAVTSTVSSTTSSGFSQARNIAEARRLSEQHELAFKKLSQSADSVAAATVLQHHNYANNSFPTPPHSTSASNTPPLTPLSPLGNAPFLPLSPQSEESNQLLIHSEDPLLSSTIKDITRKKIDLRSLTVLGSVLVERGGQLHLIQAPTATVQRLTKSNNHQPKPLNQDTSSPNPEIVPAAATTTNHISNDMAPEIAPELVSSYFKSVGIDDEEYLNSMEPGNPLSDDTATNIPVESPSEKAIFAQNYLNFVPPPKRPRLMPKYPTFKSRLRNCRRETICSASMPYTPAPMLDPNRRAAGLVASVTQPWHLPSSSQENAEIVDVFALTAPESDSFPHVNVGAKYQCPIPPCERKPYPRASDSASHKLYEPSIEAKLTNDQVISYLEFACCDAIPFGGRNQEYALHLLHLCGGDIPEATMQLMIRKPKLPRDHGLLGFNYGITKLWGYAEVDAFVRALKKHSKNWPVVAKELGKSPMHCIQFYYVWKKVCMPEYCKIRDAWEGKAVDDDLNNNRNNQENANSSPSILDKPRHPLETKIKEEKQEDDDDDATLDALAFIAEDDACLSEAGSQDTKTEMKESTVPQSNNNHFHNNVEYLYNKLSANEETQESLTESSKVENALQYMSVPFGSVPPSQEVNLVEATVRNSNNSMSLQCDDVNDSFSLTEIKTETWSFCDKDDLKQDIISANVDINDPKLFLDEFDDVKLNLLCENSDDLDETVEEAPIIVPKPELLESNHDEVKREIESMMAMHGIRMEGEDMAGKELRAFDPMQPTAAEKDLQLDIASCLENPSQAEEHVTTSSESRLFICEFADCSASFNSRAALNGHIRIHGYRKTFSAAGVAKHSTQKDFACETCGKTFGKAKNRNAHKKIHRPWDYQKIDQAEKLAAMSSGVSSSGELPLNNSSQTISFSTCVNFELNAASTKQMTPKSEPPTEYQVQTSHDACTPTCDQKDISAIFDEETPSKVNLEDLNETETIETKTVNIEEDKSKNTPTAAQLDEIFSSLLCNNQYEGDTECSPKLQQNQELVKQLVKPTV